MDPLTSIGCQTDLLPARAMRPAILLLLFLAIPGKADTWLAASPSYTDVQAAYNLASNGDTVVIPQGTGNWAQQFVLNKAITLQGAGAGQTIIVNDLSGSALIIFNNVANFASRLTGITLRNGTSTGSGSIDVGCVIRGIGSNTNGWTFRIDHCDFENLKQFPIFTNQAFGVIDHNRFTGCRGVGYTYCRNWMPTPEVSPAPSFGDGSWADPTNYATDKCIYFEDNTVVTASDDDTLFDGTRGGRLVVRHNTFEMHASNSSAVVTCHGLEGRNRSIRSIEFYNNYIVNQNSPRLLNQRGGTVVAFNNRVAGGNANPVLELTLDRAGDTIIYGVAAGNNSVDLNDTSLGGTNSNPTPKYEGDCIAGSGGDVAVVSPNPSWGAGDLVGYSLYDTNTGEAGVIISNTSNSVTTRAAIDGAFGPPHDWAVGHHVKIFRVLQAMDQTGAAGTSSADLLTGGNPPTFPPGWPTQQMEGCWEWNNIRTPSTDIDFSTSYPMIRSFALLGNPAHYTNDTVKPGYPWAAGTNSVCGADIGTNVIVAGSGGYVYPHPATVGLSVFRAAGTKSVGTIGAVTVTAPADVATGDLEILISGTDVAQTLSITWNGGSAWTPVNGTPVAAVAGTKLYVWYRIRQAGDSDPQVTPSGNFSISTRLAYQTGTFDTTTPVDTEATGTEGTADTSFSFTPGTTTSVNDSLVLVISTSGADNNTAQVPVCTNANLTDLNSRANDNTNSGGGGGYGVTEGALATAGDVGTFACTYALGSGKAYLSFAIRPSL